MNFETEYVLDTAVWQDEYLIVFTDSMKDSIAKRFKKYKIKEQQPNSEYAGAYFIPMRDVPQPYAGWILFDMNEMDNLKTIIGHECLHATANTLRHRGLNLVEDAEEAYTYTQQYFIKKVSEFYAIALKKYKLRGKKNKS